MRWVRRGLVVLVLAAPIAVVTAIAWPDEDADGGDGRDGAETDCPNGSGPDGTLAAGDRIEGELPFGGVVACRTIGTGGERRISATSPGADLTLTVVDDDGDQLAFNDDTNGLDPAVTVELDVGEDAVIEVRELGGIATSFTLSIDAND